MVLPIVLAWEVVQLPPWWRVIIRCGGHETKVDGLVGWLVLGSSGVSGWWFQRFFIFTPKTGEDSQFDDHIFQRG